MNRVFLDNLISQLETEVNKESVGVEGFLKAANNIGVKVSVSRPNVIDFPQKSPQK